MSWLDRMRQDASYAARGLRRSPGFTLAIVLTLGAGVGVNAAMLSLLDRIFVQAPAGVPRAGDIRRLYFDFVNDRKTGNRLMWPTTEYPRWRAIQQALAGRVPIAGYTVSDSTDLRMGDARIPAHRAFVTPDYFSVLDIHAARGRFFADDERDIAVPARVAVISDAYWQRAFSGDANVIGTPVVMGDDKFTVVGVAPPGFTGLELDAVDIWFPASSYPNPLPGNAWYETISLGWNTIYRSQGESTDREVAAVATRAAVDIKMPGWIPDATWHVLTGPVVQAAGPMERSPDVAVLVRVAAISVLVLVIAWANVLTLLLLRALERGREIAVRRALGVSRGRLLEQLSVEAGVLAMGGAAVAVACAWVAGAFVRRLVLPKVQWSNAPLSPVAIGFIVLCTLGMALVGGGFTALQSFRSDLDAALRTGGHASGRAGGLVRSTLIALQATLCLALIVGTGLFLRSLENVRAGGVGYRIEDRWFVRPAFDNAAAHMPELETALPQATQRLATNAGVQAAAYAAFPPLQGTMYQTVYVPGRDSLPSLPGDIGPSMNYVSPGFFNVMGLALRQGRDFTLQDRQGSERVGIISESMARAYWPGESPIGKCFTLLKRDNPCITIVGVVADAHRYMYLEPTIMQFFLPMAQNRATPRIIILHVRPGAIAQVLLDAEGTFRPLVTNMIGLRAQSIDRVLEPQLRRWSFGSTIIGLLAALALLVSAIGVSSVVAYSVRQRTAEMGIRIALGATRKNILNIVIGSGLRAVVVGVLAGIGVSLLGGRFIASALYGVTPSDGRVMSAATGILVLVAVVACLVPAWRAANVDPVNALRAD